MPGERIVRKIIANNAIMFVTAIILAVIGISVSIWQRDFSWFARSGSIITCIGIIIISRPSIIVQDILDSVKMADTGLLSNDPEHYRRLGEPIPDCVIEDGKSRKAVGILGPIVIFAGTLIWGFADLLNLLFGF
jgi:hypothetical protein